MILKNRCPDQDLIARLTTGELPQSEIERLVQHVEACPVCLHHLEHLDADDRLVAELKSRAPFKTDPDETRINTLIDHLCRLSPTLAGPEVVETSHHTLWDVRSALVTTSQTRFLGRVGPYWVESLLGAGGMGEVYRARQQRPDRAVALKILKARPSNARELLARFHVEADAAARLRHPNIVQIYEAGESADAAFIAMELVEGESLAARLAQAVLEPCGAAKLLSPLAQAVHFAHRNGVVHRDLKPSNVLIERDGTPKLSDFGMAKILGDEGSDQTQTGAVIGTPAYMAPEQASDGKAVGPAADVYGLGAILYECLTGRPPFKGSTALETLEQIRTQEPLLPGRLQPGIPRDLETICMKCLAKDPAGRYPSALTLAEDLDRFIRGEPIKARSVGVLTKVWKWAQRRPALAALTLTSGLLAVGLVVIIVTYTGRLRHEADRANRNAGEAHKQQDLATANYRSARNALASMLRRLDERRASEIPRLMELRRDLLEETLAFYEGISAGRDAEDPAIKLDIALATAAAAGIQRDLGRPKQAEENLLRAVSLFEGLPKELREQPECRKGLIYCYKHLGFSSQDRGRSAEAYFEKALAEAEALTRSDLSNADWQDELARVENSLGVYFDLMIQHDLSAQHYQRAVGIRETLLARNPQSEAYGVALGENLINLGLTYHILKNPEKAEAAFLRADGLLRPIVDAHPERYWLMLSLAALECDWGNLLREKDLPRALEKLFRAVELADAVLAQEPRFQEARTRSLQTHGARALALEMANRLPEAIKDWDRVVEVADEPKRAEYRVNRAERLLRAGDYDRVLAEAHELASVTTLQDDYRYNLACFLALSAEPTKGTPCLGALASVASADLRARTAIRLLKQIKANGFFRKPENTRYLAEDPDLALIRSRTDFQPLLIN